MVTLAVIFISSKQSKIQKVKVENRSYYGSYCMFEGCSVFWEMQSDDGSDTEVKYSISWELFLVVRLIINLPSINPILWSLVRTNNLIHFTGKFTDTVELGKIFCGNGQNCSQVCLEAGV